MKHPSFNDVRNEEDPGNPYLRVQEILTQHERERFLATVLRFMPRLRGAHVADVLDMLHDQDFCLVLTEPAYEVFKGHKHEELVAVIGIAAWYLHVDFDPDQSAATVEHVRELLARVP